MFKRKCYLCGGRLASGRCLDCGMKNQNARRKTYRLNYSAVENKMKNPAKVNNLQTEKELQRDQKPKEKVKAPQNRAPVPQKNTYVPDPSISERRTSVYRAGRFETPQKGRKGLSAFIVILSVIVTIAGAIGSYRDKKQVETTYEPIQTETDTTSTPYDYVTYELSDEGDEFEIVLEPGEYKVGVHIPEGTYEVFLEAGTGSVSVQEHENYIYMGQSFGDNEEYNQVKEWPDVRLYQGATFDVSGDVSLRLYTENAQNDKMSSYENPLTKEVKLPKGKTLIAGEDFPEGVYDFQAIFEWTGISYTIPLHTDYENEELNFLNKSQGVFPDDQDVVYRNVVLTKGTSICAKDADAMLVPSELIESEDYDSYYDSYRY
ncbi:MAG: hypothetical protein QM793_07185 [Muricomes sp.]